MSNTVKMNLGITAMFTVFLCIMSKLEVLPTAKVL